MTEIAGELRLGLGASIDLTGDEAIDLDRMRA